MLADELRTSDVDSDKPQFGCPRVSTDPPLSEVACPGCRKVGSLRIAYRFHLDHKAGLSGTQIKFSGKEVPVLVCECGFEEYAS